MSYTPTQWSNGDVITAEKLNNLESGITSEVLYVEVNYDSNDNLVANETFQTILNAIQDGAQVFVYNNSGDGYYYTLSVYSNNSIQFKHTNIFVYDDTRAIQQKVLIIYNDESIQIVENVINLSDLFANVYFQVEGISSSTPPIQIASHSPSQVCELIQMGIPITFKLKIPSESSPSASVYTASHYVYADYTSPVEIRYPVVYFSFIYNNNNITVKIAQNQNSNLWTATKTTS